MLNTVILTAHMETPSLLRMQCAALASQRNACAKVIAIEAGRPTEELAKAHAECAAIIDMDTMWTGSWKLPRRSSHQHGDSLDAGMKVALLDRPDVIIALDSDCLPEDEDFLATVLDEVKRAGVTGAHGRYNGVQSFHISLLAARTDLMETAWIEAGGFAPKTFRSPRGGEVHWDAGALMSVILRCPQHKPTDASHLHCWTTTRLTAEDEYVSSVDAKAEKSKVMRKLTTSWSHGLAIAKWGKRIDLLHEWKPDQRSDMPDTAAT